ncbi:MAG TPA: DUF3891 family protein [Steroidobacteraceae bacterium]|nr:DUF3891 family protein [Steroidobacteraceae bacterium]
MTSPSPAPLSMILRPPTLALLALQLADHWGNRHTPRPHPRAEVLTATLLGALATSGDSPAPQRDREEEESSGHARAACAGEPEWAEAIARATACGRYVGFLVSECISAFVAAHHHGEHEAFLAEQESWRQRLRAELAGEPRYAQVFRAPDSDCNPAIVHLCQALARHLAVDGAEVARFTGLPQLPVEATLEVRRIGMAAYRLWPWPFLGRRLTVRAEAERDANRSAGNPEEVPPSPGGVIRSSLAWTLLAPSTPAD